MSVTTTDNAALTTTRHYLADYDLTHTQPDSHSSAPPPSAQPTGPTATNPPGWEDRWRRVPAYRPVQNQLDEQRNSYTSEVERNFVRVLFSGIFIVSSASQLWRATGGKINSDYFTYKIGGEW